MDKETDNNKISVIFPGIGYNPSMPLLYYGRDISIETGYAECRQVTYNGPGEVSLRGKFDDMEKAFQTLYLRARENLSNIDWSAYDDILFISKSIGTVIAAAYAEEMGLNDKKIRHILYTPLEYTFRFNPKDAIGFIGTNDRYSDTSKVLKLADEQGIPMFVYEGTNHSLELHDITRDVLILKDVMAKTVSFVKTGKVFPADNNSDGTPFPGNKASAVGPAAQETGRTIWGRVDEKNIRIDLSEILYIESVDDKVFAYTPESVARIDKTLNSFIAETNDEAFFRCSKSMVINVNRVRTLKSLSSNRIDATMEGGEHIIISRRFASEFRRLLKGER